MSNKIYYVTLNTIGARTFVMPPGFEPSVEIHCWGAGGGSGRGGAVGGGGGYAKSTVTVNVGDRVTLQIGQPGTNGSYPTGGKGGVDASYTLFRGGNSSDATDEDADTGAGGGGGGASWVAVNGTYVCVGAGGGGAGGYGDDSSGGYPGLPGGVTSNGLSTSYAGGNAPAGWSTGGGGGAGYPRGGAAGTSYGDDAPNPPAGSGGQNYGNVTVAGSGPTPGGKSVSLYPGNRLSEAGYPGYIVLVLTKKLNIFNKNPDGSGNWVNIDTAYYKVPTQTIYSPGPPVTSTVNYSTSGPGTWTVPVGITSLTIDLVGGGGGGGYSNRNSAVNVHQLSGGGGGSGGYQRITVPVTPGQVISYTVGARGAGAPQNPKANQNPNIISPRLPSEVYATAGGPTSVTIGGITYTVNGGGAGGNANWVSGTAGSAGSAGSPGGNAGQAGEVVINTQTDPRGGGVGFATGGAGGRSPYGNAGAGGAGASVGQVLTNFTEAAYGGANGGSGLVSITYATAPSQVITVAGGWKQIQQAWVKISGLWKPLIVQTIINLSKIFAIPKTVTYSSAGTYTFTVETGTSSLLVTATGAGGGGGGGHDPCGNSSHVGGLGGGGYVASREITVVPGDVITVTVGSGGAGGAANGSGSNGNPTIIQLNSVEVFRADPGLGGAPGTGSGRGRGGAGGSGGNGGASGLGAGSVIHTGGAGGAGRAVISYSIFNIT